LLPGTARKSTAPTQPAQFVIPNFEGPITAQEAKLGAIFELNPEAQAAMGRLIARVGRGGIEQAAEYVQASSRAARFVAEHGESGVYALLEADGDAVLAETKLPKLPAPAVREPAPLAVASKEPASGAAKSAPALEAAEQATLREHGQEPVPHRGNLPETTCRRPAARHTLRKVTQGSVAKNLNTVIEPRVNVADDVEAINAGRAVPGMTSDGIRTYTVNGRIYGIEGNGTLFPMSGNGFNMLNRNAYKLLGIFNGFGETKRAFEIVELQRPTAKFTDEDIESGLHAWRAGQGGE
jgi:hypothetical protein